MNASALSPGTPGAAVAAAQPDDRDERRRHHPHGNPEPGNECHSHVRAVLRGVSVVGTGLEVAGCAFAALDTPPTVRRRARAQALQTACTQALVLHGVDVACRGVLPAEPVIVVANHASWLDPLVVASLLPVTPIAKHEVRRWPFVGSLCASLGCMFVERGSASSGAMVLRSARAALAEGVSVLGFPEGTTRAFGTGLGPFHRGLFGLARRLRIPVVPVSIRYDDRAVHWVGDDAFAPHWYGLLGRQKTNVRVRIGAPLRPLAGAPLGRFVAEARHAIESLCDDEPSSCRWAA
jgi:1-acyl-sn-glycerol-3-phosphate acyltransferase